MAKEMDESLNPKGVERDYLINDKSHNVANLPRYSSGLVSTGLSPGSAGLLWIDHSSVHTTQYTYILPNAIVARHYQRDAYNQTDESKSPSDYVLHFGTDDHAKEQHQHAFHTIPSSLGIPLNLLHHRTNYRARPLKSVADNTPHGCNESAANTDPPVIVDSSPAWTICVDPQGFLEMNILESGLERRSIKPGDSLNFVTSLVPSIMGDQDINSISTKSHDQLQAWLQGDEGARLKSAIKWRYLNCDPNKPSSQTPIMQHYESGNTQTEYFQSQNGTQADAFRSTRETFQNKNIRHASSWNQQPTLLRRHLKNVILHFDNSGHDDDAWNAFVRKRTGELGWETGGASSVDTEGPHDL